MTDFKKRLDSIIAKTNRKLIEENQIPPIKTPQGILVGDVLIVSDGAIKHLYKNNHLVYKEISLNVVAIRLANLLAKNLSTTAMRRLYHADQSYGKWFFDSQFHRNKYEKALSKNEYDKADILWARYSLCRERAHFAKRTVESLLSSS